MDEMDWERERERERARNWKKEGNHNFLFIVQRKSLKMVSWELSERQSPNIVKILNLYIILSCTHLPLLSSSYPFHAMHSLLVQLCLRYLIGS